MAREDVIQGLINRGLAPHVAEGIANEINRESGFNPGINEISPIVPGSRGGFGLFQHTGPRRRELEAFAQARGVPVSDQDAQLDFALQELATTESRAGQSLSQTTTAEEAADVFKRQFLRPLSTQGGGGSSVAAGGSGADALQESPEDRIHRFYQEGLLSPERRAQYETRFPERIPTPQQAPATSATPAPQQELPPTLLEAYNAGNLSPERTQVVTDFLAAQQVQQPVQNQGPQEGSGSFGDGLLRQLGLTGRAGAEGAAGLIGLAYDPIAALLNLGLSDESQIPQLQDNINQRLTDAGVPNPEGTAERIVQKASQALVGAGGTVAAARGIGAVLTGQVGQQVASTLAQAPGAQLAGGAASGGAAQTAAEAGAGPAAQAAAGLAGGVLGAGVTTLAGTRVGAPNVAQRQAVQEAERAGITPLTSDVRTPETFAAKWLQRVGEMVPIAGTGSVRRGQQQQRVGAVRNLLRDFGADDAAGASDDVMADLLKTRRADINKYSTMKREVFANVADAGSVPVTSTTAAIDDEIARLTSLNTAELRPVISRLQDWRNAVQDQGIDNVEILRQQLGESFSAPELAGVRTTGEKSLSRIYPAIRQDIGDFIKENGDRRDFTRWQVANKRLSQSIGEMNVTALKSALKRGDMTPEAINSLLFSQKPSDARALFRNLSPAGRANARAAVLNRALTKATVGEDISPAKCASELTRLGTPVGVFFGGKDRQQVQGLVRALNMTRRASDAAVSTPTGLQAVPAVGAAVLTDLLGGFGAGLTGAASIGGAARLYESKPVRDALIALSRVKVGSAEEARILKRVISAAQQFEQPEEGTP